MWARLDHGWRVCATGLCFMAFGIGGLVLTLVACPLVRVLVHPAARRKRVGQRLIWANFAGFTKLMTAVGVLEYDVRGRAKLERRGCVVVANHPSLIDVVLLLGVMPRADCIVKQPLWNSPVTGAPLRMAGYIPNAGGPELVERACASLEAGNRLLVFPEGTRTRPGQPLRLQRGAANIAVHARADVVPVTIRLSEATLGKHHRWYQVPRRRLRVCLSVDDPIRIEPYLAEGVSKALAARRLTEDMRHYYARRLQSACEPGAALDGCATPHAIDG